MSRVDGHLVLYCDLVGYSGSILDFSAISYLLVKLDFFEGRSTEGICSCDFYNFSGICGVFVIVLLLEQIFLGNPISLVLLFRGNFSGFLIGVEKKQYVGFLV